ncbi:MAG: hypothetical protein ABI315_04240 [Bacteroidia bacterium]
MSQPDTLHAFNNSVYVEALGIGGYGSLNYERILFSKNKLKLAVRLGASTYHVMDYRLKFNPDIILPISLNALFGNRHLIEMGLGQTITSLVSANEFRKAERNNNLHATFNIGYRYEKSRMLFRICYSPIIEYYNSIRHWGGISFGYRF